MKLTWCPWCVGDLDSSGFCPTCEVLVVQPEPEPEPPSPVHVCYSCRAVLPGPEWHDGWGCQTPGCGY